LGRDNIKQDGKAQPQYTAHSREYWHHFPVVFHEAHYKSLSFD
jgi:hypothetical protein